MNRPTTPSDASTTLPYASPELPHQLERGLGLPQAVALNIANMVGIGPFITIPLFISAMGGPQALVGWVIAAVLVLCDGLVWSELGAALPSSGGTYHFLREAFGRYRWGRLMPFLFIWQFLVSGTLEQASGYIGVLAYVKYALPNLDAGLGHWHVPGGLATLGAVACAIVTVLLCRRIRIVGWLSIVLCIGTLVTVLIVIVAGLTHFDRQLFVFPKGAFALDKKWFAGLGAAMAIAVYDFLGYYNICHLGDEVKNPGRTIPRAVILSVLLIGALYLTMSISIMGVVPWREAMKSENIAATFMERLFGRGAAVTFTWFVVWTAVASLFAGTLGYSRIPYAAARAGDFFPVFARVHPRKHYPYVSLLAFGALTMVFCFFSLDLVINATVSIRILIQFVGQIAALHVVRVTRPDVVLPFRMWLYPLPSLVALVGWSFVWWTTPLTVMLAGLGVLAVGCAVFLAWQMLRARR